MPEYLLLMHNDATTVPTLALWQSYFAFLRKAEAFEGGSSIGSGTVLRKNTPSADVTERLTGYIKIVASSAEAAAALVIGNPVYEAGGSVEIRELPAD